MAIKQNAITALIDWAIVYLIDRRRLLLFSLPDDRALHLETE